MPKYLIETDGGKYLIETADATGGDALTGGMPVPNAFTDPRAQGARNLAALGDAAGDIQLPTNPYGGAPVVTVNPDKELARVPANLQLPASMALGGYAGPGRVLEGAGQIANAKTADDVYGGASKVLRGGMQTLAPTLGAAAIAAPLATATGLVVGSGAGKLAHMGLKAVGASDNVADLGEDITGLVAGGAAGHGYGKITEPIRDFGLPFMLPSENGRGIPGLSDLSANIGGALVGKAIGGKLDPSEAAAAQYAREQGVHTRASVLTGSKVAGNAEKILEHLPFGPGAIAADARAAEQTTLGAAGAREVAGLNPDAPAGAAVPTPLDAGEALQKAALEKEKGHSAAAGDAYNLLRSIEAQPKFKETVETGTRRVLDPANVDESGNPVYKDEPVTKDIQLPVDLRFAKQHLKPVLEDMLQLMPLAQQQSNVGIKALTNVVEGPDFASASVTDRNLGAIKAILRETQQDNSRRLAGFAVDQLSKAVDKAVERAGPDAVAALKRGREETTNKYDTQDYQKALGFKNVGMPDVAPGSAVDLVGKLTADSDRNIDLLRQVAANHPEHVPAIAQAKVQSLLDKVTAEAGMAKNQTALTEFNKQGAQTRRILYGDRTQGLQNFFTLAKKVGENPNPSGSGTLLAMGKMGLLLATKPHVGVPLLISAKAAAKMLFNPETSNLMQTALRLKPDAPGAGLLGAQLAKAATAAGGQPAPAAAGPGAASAAAAPKTSPDTFVTVPGEPANAYKAQYKVVERSTLNASHSGKNFNPNPNYTLKNDRDYTTAGNQGTVIGWSSRAHFDPKQLINDNPDAGNGPVVIDAKGNVLGGNGRAMILERVASDPAHPGSAAYRDLLKQKASQFGIDPAAIDGMKEPVLVREVADSEFAGRSKQDAISDFNKTGTKELTPSEKAVRDANRVSPETLEHVAGLLEKQGPDATVAEVLADHGQTILNRLIKDGVVTDQERNALEGEHGLTDEGKDRIAFLMAGRFFADSKTLDTIAPAVRNKVTRLAAPLAQVQGRGEWNLTPATREAVELLHRAQSLGGKNVDDFIKTDGLFGDQKYSAQAKAIARAIQKLTPNELVAAARQYASDANHAAGGAGLFGAAPDAAASFADAFGAEAVDKTIAAREAAKAAKKNALAPDKGAAAIERRRNDGQAGSVPLRAFAPKNALAREGEGGGGGGGSESGGGLPYKDWIQTLAADVRERFFDAGMKIRNGESVTAGDLAAFGPRGEAELKNLQKDYAPRPPAPAAAPPQVVKSGRSGFELVEGKFDALTSGDDYLYHVTTKANAAKILSQGLTPGAARSAMADGFYRDYSKGKVFLSDAGGVSYWKERIADHIENETGRAPNLVVLRIPKELAGKLEADTLGARDSRVGSFFATSRVGKAPAANALAGEGGGDRGAKQLQQTTLYHSTGKSKGASFDEFNGPTWVTPERAYADQVGGGGGDVLTPKFTGTKTVRLDKPGGYSGTEAAAALRKAFPDITDKELSEIVDVDAYPTPSETVKYRRANLPEMIWETNEESANDALAKVAKRNGVHAISFLENVGHSETPHKVVFVPDPRHLSLKKR